MKVSIIIPVYNVMEFLGDCLDAIGRQTFRDFEVIAVDDGSTDGSSALLDGYEASFPMTRLHRANRGVSVTRNEALDRATGDYVLMVDSDDCIHPRLLELAVGAAEAHGADWVAFDYAYANRDELPQLLDRWAVDLEAPSAQDIPSPGFDWFVASRRLPTPWQILYRRSSLGKLRFREGIVYEDVPFILTYLARPLKGVYLEKPLYCYVTNDRSITHGTELLRRFFGFETGMRMLREELDEARYRAFVRKESLMWIRGLWRKVRALPESEDRAGVEAAFNAFIARLFRDGLLRCRDLRPVWWWRFLKCRVANRFKS